ncbi:YgaP family membrane protein [Capnocytophaga granulosa]|jgi:hypothetical protein|uniref:YgaP family membrane protein n=1 Tax=Capnocytophaga granulosa TaxID=45242 RepID=UPI0023F043A9|nr:DUF2892 domain-containing protein [Capnocytophaga granulosa]
MERNIGKKDKQIRLLFVLVVAILGELKLITNDTVASVLAAISIVFIVTILLNFSPIYRLFGISTYKVTNDKRPMNNDK